MYSRYCRPYAGLRIGSHERCVEPETGLCQDGDTWWSGRYTRSPEDLRD